MTRRDLRSRCYLCGDFFENIMRHLTSGACPGKGWKPDPQDPGTPPAVSHSSVTTEGHNDAELDPELPAEER